MSEGFSEGSKVHASMDFYCNTFTELFEAEQLSIIDTDVSALYLFLSLVRMISLLLNLRLCSHSFSK